MPHCLEHSLLLFFTQLRRDSLSKCISVPHLTTKSEIDMLKATLSFMCQEILRSIISLNKSVIGQERCYGHDVVPQTDQGFDPCRWNVTHIIDFLWMMFNKLNGKDTRQFISKISM